MTNSIYQNPGVEIETEWNLEKIIKHMTMINIFVEIETEWNLEYRDSHHRNLQKSGRDRNRVEFRVFQASPSPKIFPVEIETEWNLELSLCIPHNRYKSVEIETEWNLEELIELYGGDTRK